VSTTNTKIWFLLLAAGALFCAGCASTMQTQQANFDRARAFVESRYGDSLDSHQKAVLALEMSREMSQEDFARRQAIALMISRAGEGFSEGMRTAQTPIPPLRQIRFRSSKSPCSRNL
jgi:hypothetical protein